MDNLTIFIIAYTAGFILNMIGMFEYDKLQTNFSGRWGFTKSFFVSLFFGWLIGYIFLVFTVFAYFNEIWERNIAK